MGSLRTLITALAVLVYLPSPVVGAANLVETFATCSGRLTAQLEFEWLMSDPRADQTEQSRAAMVSLLETIVPADGEGQVIAMRVNARAAHGALLTRATFNGDRDDAKWAARRAAQQVAACRNLLLS